MRDLHYLVPLQQQGLEKDVHHSVLAENNDDANDWFVDAKDRMLNVNNWSKYAGIADARFMLRDNQGKEVRRNAHKGDHIRIDLAGAEPAKDFDWVAIEAIVYDDYPDQDMESFAIRVRPIANSQSVTTGSTDNGATSTFVIERMGRKLVAAWHGRNESGMTEPVIHDNIGANAWLGLAERQIAGLMEGWLK